MLSAVNQKNEGAEDRAPPGGAGGRIGRPYASTAWIFRLLSIAIANQTHAHPPHAQNVNNVRMKCRAWLGPVTITPAGVGGTADGAGLSVGASGATAVH